MTTWRLAGAAVLAILVGFTVGGALHARTMPERFAYVAALLIAVVVVIFKYADEQEHKS